MVAPARRLEPVPRPGRPDPRTASGRVRAGGAAVAAGQPRHVGRPDAPARAPKAAPPRPQLRIVAPRVRRRRAGLVAAAVCLSTFLVMLALTVFQARIAAEQMRLEQLDRDIAAEQSYSTRLRLAVAQAQTPEQAALRAQAEGLQLPEDGIEIYASPTLTDVVAVVTADASSAPAGGTP